MIALGVFSHPNLYKKFLLVNISNNELVNAFPKAPTKNNSSLVPTSCIFILGHGFIAFFTSTALFSFKELFKKFIEICIKKVKEQILFLLLIEAKKKWLKKLFKAKNSKLHFENLQIECFYFFRQCKNYFKTFKAKRHKCVFL